MDLQATSSGTLMLLCCLLMAVVGVEPSDQSQSKSSSSSSALKRNYYETLDITQTASDKDVKRAFRKLAMKYHPDKNKSPDAEKTFREIAEAYGVLSNKDKRRLYDQLGHQAFLKNEEEFGGASDDHGGPPPEFFFNFDQMFGDMFMFDDDGQGDGQDDEGTFWSHDPGQHWTFFPPPGGGGGGPGDEFFAFGDFFEPSGGHQGHWYQDPDQQDSDPQQQYCWNAPQPDGSTARICSGG